jgi:hypothetical protein
MMIIYFQIDEIIILVNNMLRNTEGFCSGGENICIPLNVALMEFYIARSLLCWRTQNFGAGKINSLSPLMVPER